MSVLVGFVLMMDSHVMILSPMMWPERLNRFHEKQNTLYGTA